MSFSRQYLSEAQQILAQIDVDAIDRIVKLLVETRAGGGRLFILGVGGSAANASHAVNDFRKIAGIEAYAPTDNVSELTARTNDEGWSSVFDGWLRVSRLKAGDAVLVFSVGGGNLGSRGQSESGDCASIREVSGREDRRRRRPGWRIHRQGRRRLRHHSDGECGARDAAFRGVSGGGLASHCVASGHQEDGDQVGIGPLIYGLRDAT